MGFRVPHPLYAEENHRQAANFLLLIRHGELVSITGCLFILTSLFPSDHSNSRRTSLLLHCGQRPSSMRLPRIATLCLLAPPVFSEPIWTSGGDPQSPSYQFSPTPRDGSPDANPSLRRLRDYVVELIFGKPAFATPPRPARRNIWAAYEDDVVVRFNLTEPHEEIAIADAVDRLYKDVWSYGSGYVDIRMHKDDIAPFVSLLPVSLWSSYITLIPDLASLVFHSYPSKYLSEGYLDLPGDVYSLSGPQLPAAYGDNVFFDDYQPLPVSSPGLSLCPQVRTTSLGLYG